MRTSATQNASASPEFSIPAFNGADLDARIVDLGLLLGLLSSPSSSPTDPQTTVNAGWFGSIPAELAKIPQNAVPLLDLLQRLLSGLDTPQAAEPDGSTVSPVRLWFNIPYNGNPTPLNIVLPQVPGASHNLISLGFSSTFTQDSETMYVYGVVPVFQVPESASSTFVLGQATAPIELHVTFSGGASTGGNGLSLSTTFSFHSQPTFSLQFLAATTPTGPLYTSLADLVANGLPLLRTIVSAAACQAFLNQAIGATKATPGTILGPSPAGLGFLTSINRVWSIGDLTPFEGKSSAAFAMQVFEIILSALASAAAPLVPVPAGQTDTGIFVTNESDGQGGTDYGFRIALPAVELPVGSPGTDPTLTLQIGAWLSGENTKPTDNTWWSRAATGTGVPAEPSPGISLLLLNSDSADKLSFTGELELASLGVTFEPPAQQSLVSLGGFTLGGVEVRGYAKLDLTASPALIGYGGAILCRQIGLPLGQSFENAGGVASTVLAAGGAGDPQPDQAVNPALSVSAAFVSGSSTPVAVQFYDASGTPQSPLWLPIQKSFGPLHLDKMGASWLDARGSSPGVLTLDLDGSINLGPLDVALVDLSIGMSANAPLDTSQYTLGLQGMNVSFSNGPVSLDAGLVNTGTQFIGEAAIKASQFNIGAIGAFGIAAGQPSLFVFGWTIEPIGGPACFYVTGLAAGFGYNRGLKLPTVDQVQQFPLLAALSSTSAPFGSGSQLDQANTALNLLIAGNYVPETRGDYWFAAGVQFKTFELVQSSALLAVEFGPDLTIALLGLSTFTLGSNESPYIYIELQLDASLKPDDGVLMVQGQLTQNSYVLDPDCHITGGFAFGFWFGSSPNAGDFVVTIGGFHPLFTPPPYYPTVPRLAIYWDVGGGVTIQGDAYFAITPGCVMAGGGLQAAYQSGNLRAWFDAQADMLVNWQPFSFLADISISIGASYKINLLFVSVTLSVELGASLQLWGPPTGGTVGIDWYVISFTIGFGSGAPDQDEISWSDFVQKLLPNQAPGVGSQQSGLLTASADPPAQQPRIDVQLTAGTVRQDPNTGWIVRADGLAFTVRCSVPAIALTFTAGVSTQLTADTYALGIVPLNVPYATSMVEVTIAPVAGGTGQINGKFTGVPNIANLPAALWGSAPAPAPSSTLMPLPTGLDVSADSYGATGIAPIPITTLEYDVIDPDSPPLRAADPPPPPPAPLPLSPAARVAQASGTENAGSLSLIQSTILSPALRTAVLSAAADFGYGAGLTGAPTRLAQNIPLNLRAPTMLGSPAGIVWPT